MVVDSVRVQHFRSVVDATLSFAGLTALVGPNGAGKSCFLRALDLFYSASQRIDQNDFYACDISCPIEITVTFVELEGGERELFHTYLRGEELSVTRRIAISDGKISAHYHGLRRQNPEFVTIRSLPTATARKAEYSRLKENSKYDELPKWSSNDAAISAMADWEANHADQCQWERDEGNFFGFTGVGQGYLGRYTKLIYIPAVREAAHDVQERKGGPITELVDWLVREKLSQRDEVQEFKAQAQTQYQKILEPGLVDLKALGAQLTTTLQSYVPEAKIDMDWTEANELEFPLPQADVRLVEDNFSCAVDRTGHGLQRAFILTLLQHVALVQTEADQNSGISDGLLDPKRVEPKVPKQPNVLLAIEEPEIYQHPNRQRHFAKVLLQLTKRSAEAGLPKTQVVYSTHSPLLVGIDRFNQIRRLRKVATEPNKPKSTEISHTTFDAIAKELWEACDRKDSDGAECEQFTATTLASRLATLMTPWVNESFFADVAVLVEGEDDRAAILGTAAYLGYDFESVGVSVIPVGGKTKLDRLLLILQKLNIPYYVVWDSDFDRANSRDSAKLIQTNQRLLRLMGQKVEDFPEYVSERFACFKAKLEVTLQEELGDIYSELLEKFQDEFEYPDKDSALKSPLVVSNVLATAKTAGKTSKTLEAIISKIVLLKQGVMS